MSPAIPALLLAAVALSSPAAELRISREAGPCPVQASERWGWRVEVFQEGPGRWLVRTQGPDPAVPDPPALRPLEDAVRNVRSRLVYAPEVWTEDPEAALRAGRGNCISYTVLLERDLARLGYRTRRVHGLLLSPESGSNPYYLSEWSASPHRWLEVFTAGHGWVPLDPVAADGRLTGRHLALPGDDTAAWLKATRIEVLRWD